MFAPVLQIFTQTRSLCTRVLGFLLKCSYGDSLVPIRLPFPCASALCEAPIRRPPFYQYWSQYRRRSPLAGPIIMLADTPSTMTSAGQGFGWVNGMFLGKMDVSHLAHDKLTAHFPDMQDTRLPRRSSHSTRRTSRSSSSSSPSSRARNTSARGRCSTSRSTHWRATKCTCSPSSR